MELIVERNLAIARRGGNPGILPLINAFLNVKHFKTTETTCQVCFLSIFH